MDISELVHGGFEESYDVSHIKDAREQFEELLFDSDYCYYVSMYEEDGKVFLWVGDAGDV